MADITLILPTYQRPETLKRSLQSVLDQTYKDFRILVCDNGSDEKTYAMMRAYEKKDPRVIYTRHSENIGLINNFVFGLSLVNTPFFTFLSDDDWIFPWFFESSIQKMKEFFDIKAVVNSILTVNHKNQICEDALEHWDREGYFPPPLALKYAAQNNCSVWSGILFRQEVLTTLGGLDKEAGTAFDVDFLFRLFAVAPVYVNKAPAGVFYLQPPNKTSSMSVGSVYPGIFNIIKKINQNTDLDYETRTKSEKYLMLLFERVVKAIFKSCLYKKNYQEAYRCVELLNQNLGIKFKFIKVLVRLIAYLPFIRYLLMFSYHFKFLYKMKFFLNQRRLKKKYIDLHNENLI